MSSPWFPIVGESLAVDFANTTYYAHGVLEDGLATRDGLSAWLAAVEDRLGFAAPHATNALRDQAVGLRSAVRAVFAAVLSGESPPRRAVQTINAAVRRGPTWPELAVTGGQLAAATGVRDRRQAALAAVATDVIARVTGPDRERLGSCDGPGCVGFLLRADQRQHFCSPRCATRLRALRHYHRAR